MTWYDEKRIEVIAFAKANGINMSDLARISRDLATCDSCIHYCQHYDADGEYVPFGHCTRLKNRARKPHESSCGSWEYKDRQIKEQK